MKEARDAGAMDAERNDVNKRDQRKRVNLRKRSALRKRRDLGNLRAFANLQGVTPSRGREAGVGDRRATRLRDTSLIRVETVNKLEMEAFRLWSSKPYRLRPHWEVFALLMVAALERDRVWWRRRLRRWDRDRAAAAAVERSARL